ncbi:MAG: iron ABC transporter permease [Candidatus Tectomicrobia bacterium]|uniref:Iron ABC transporter permease n=1 Tax=Tectimicrobiota bacterium TaxID=2528274 RepID=A0A932I3J5_UNCTE|nr:iron ABC transporter permease [Candidatus Tectomicrobia bacterium]
MVTATESFRSAGRTLRRGFHLDLWTAGAALIAAVVAAPLFFVLLMALSPSGGIWEHLLATVLARYVRTTLSLMLGVGLGTLFIGTAAAWLVSLHQFPGRRLFEWALLLPMAMPAYIIAYVYTDLLEYAGPAQVFLRTLFGWTSGRDYWFPEIRSLGGAIAMMTLVLYPYVYLLARAAFAEQSLSLLEASRTLGCGPWRSFLTVALPMARPAIVVGVSLALMETLNDYGTVDFFAVQTFTLGIFDVWLNMNSVSGAAQLALVALAFVLALIGTERWARRNQRFYQTGSKYRAVSRQPLQGKRRLLASAACFVPILLGFLLPAGVLLRYALRYSDQIFSGNYLAYAWNSLLLSAVSAVAAVAAGLFMAYGARVGGGKAVRAAAQFASTGYAVPGAVLAIGVLIPLSRLDAALDALWRGMTGASAGYLLTGSITAVVYGYLVRFLALSHGASRASLAKITPGMEGVARTLGHGPFRTLLGVHLPLIRGSLLAAGILVFVDGMKELPMTLILRPFNYETLATYVHQYASRGLLEESALGALTIVASGILPVILLSATIRSAPRSGDFGDPTRGSVPGTPPQAEAAR